jgi:hypothetical protein
MATKELTSKEYFRILNKLHLAILSGLALFTILAYYLVSIGFADKTAEGLFDIFQTLALIFAVAGFGGSIYMTWSRMKATKLKTNLKEKTADYYTTLVIKLALLFGPALFATMGFMLTANYILLLLDGIIIFAFLFYMPTRAKVLNDLKLNQAEIASIYDQNSIISVLPENSKKW